VKRAYLLVKAKAGASGVDKETIGQFEKDLEDNLTVADRVAQTVVKMIIESTLEKVFLPDSYGYRPNKSALDAVGVTRKRCWRYDWILEFDIKGLFDNLPHDLLLKAVRKHVQEK
jgi:RNA-directed DNA polymerase